MSLLYGMHAIKARLKLHADGIKVIYCLKGKETSPRLGELKSLMAKKDVEFELVNKEKFQALLQSHALEEVVHQNVLAVCQSDIKLYEESDLIELIRASSRTPFVLILDGVQDPHNLGACIRSAEAAGVDFIVFPKDNSATINATVEKVASGAASSMRLVVVTNLSRAIGILKDEGVWVTGLAGEAESLIYDNDFTGAIALVMGAEGSGLRFGTRKMCDYLAKLPMHGQVSSLNVSVAAGIAMYEVVRQRCELLTKNTN
ncbi:23S rRNA (guanosine(2251)-2'-O)-methyltransferase RlmB [Cysteiniphilum halobium]|uniref:23S rRNA (guanosine(2251)-2'-O)-methyltransferase RlmB n=1 Tax=Cysteiniphilum halobium TaxID=2219059 RepID=UPI003F859E3D